MNYHSMLSKLRIDDDSMSSASEADYFTLFRRDLNPRSPRKTVEFAKNTQFYCFVCCEAKISEFGKALELGILLFFVQENFKSV